MTRRTRRLSCGFGRAYKRVMTLDGVQSRSPALSDLADPTRPSSGRTGEGSRGFGSDEAGLPKLPYFFCRPTVQRPPDLSAPSRHVGALLTCRRPPYRIIAPSSPYSALRTCRRPPHCIASSSPYNALQTGALYLQRPPDKSTPFSPYRALLTCWRPPDRTSPSSPVRTLLFIVPS